MGIEKSGRSEQDVDIIAVELGHGDVNLGADHVLNAEGQIGHRDFVFQPVIDAIDVLIEIARQVQHRFPHRLAGNGAGIDADSAHAFRFFDDGHVLAGFRSLNGRALAGGAGPDDDEIESLHT